MRFRHAPTLLMLALATAAGCTKRQPERANVPAEVVLADMLVDLTALNYQEGVLEGAGVKLADLDRDLQSTDPLIAKWRNEIVKTIGAYMMPDTPKGWWNTPLGVEFVRMPMIYLAPDFQNANKENPRGDRVWQIEKLREYLLEGRTRTDLRLTFPNHEPFEPGVYEFTYEVVNGAWWIARMPMPMERPDRLLSYWLNVTERDLRDLLDKHDPSQNPVAQHPTLRNQLVEYLDRVVSLPEGAAWSDPEVLEALSKLVYAVDETRSYKVDTSLVSQSRDETEGTWTVWLQRTYWIEGSEGRATRIVHLEVQRGADGQWRIVRFPKSG